MVLKPIDPKRLIRKPNPIHLSEYLESVAPDEIVQMRPNIHLNLLALDTRNNKSTKALLGAT